MIKYAILRAGCVPSETSVCPGISHWLYIALHYPTNRTRFHTSVDPLQYSIFMNYEPRSSFRRSKKIKKYDYSLMISA